MRLRFVYNPNRPAQLHGLQLLPMLFDVMAQQQAANEQRAAIARQDAEIARQSQLDAAERARIESTAKQEVDAIRQQSEKEISKFESNQRSANRMSQMAYHNRQRLNRAIEACMAENKKLRIVVRQLQQQAAA